MTGWASILFYDDEDEAALKARFVDLWAVHKERSAYEVAQYVFKDLKEPELRADKAAQVWSKDLDVLEQIRLRRLNPEGNGLASKEKTAAEILALAQNNKIGDKERVAAYRLYSDVMGFTNKVAEPAGANRDTNTLLKTIAEMLPG
jgi:hypothetical protein